MHNQGPPHYPYQPLAPAKRGVGWPVALLVLATLAIVAAIVLGWWVQRGENRADEVQISEQPQPAASPAPDASVTEDAAPAAPDSSASEATPLEESSVADGDGTGETIAGPHVQDLEPVEPAGYVPNPPPTPLPDKVAGTPRYDGLMSSATSAFYGESTDLTFVSVYEAALYDGQFEEIFPGVQARPGWYCNASEYYDDLCWHRDEDFYYVVTSGDPMPMIAEFGDAFVDAYRD